MVSKSALAYRGNGRRTHRRAPVSTMLRDLSLPIAPALYQPMQPVFVLTARLDLVGA